MLVATLKWGQKFNLKSRRLYQIADMFIMHFIVISALNNKVYLLTYLLK